MEAAEDRFDELVARYLAGAESESEFAALQGFLRESRQYRRRFLDASLQAQGCSEVCAEVCEPARAVSSPRRWKPVALGFAAAAAIAGIVLLLPKPEAPETISSSPDKGEALPSGGEELARQPSLVDPQPRTPGLVAWVARSTELHLDPLILGVEDPEFLVGARVTPEISPAWLEEIDLICAHRPGFPLLADDLKL